MLIQCPEFLGFLAAKNPSSVVHLNNTSALLQYILVKEAFRANLNWSSYSDFRADKQFLTPAEAMVHVAYLELQTEICGSVSASCKKCFPHFLLLPFVNEPQENKAKIHFCIAGRKLLGFDSDLF